MPLHVETQLTDGFPVHVVTGELDIYTVPGFTQRLVELTSEASSVVLDVRGVELIDSSGLGALLRLARTSGVTRLVVLVCHGPAIPRLLDLVRLNELFVTVATRNEAVRAARGVRSDTEDDSGRSASPF